MKSLFTHAPLIVFCYNRPLHLKYCISSIKKNEEFPLTPLIFYSDGPKNIFDKEKISEVRRIINNIEGFKSITIFENKKNLGLSNSLISGASEIINKYGKAIILEDDMIVSPFFLKYMNEALNFHENEEKVISIHGYCIPTDFGSNKTFFMRGADCWGWATWKRGWNYFQNDGEALLEELKSKSLTYAFDFDGTFPYTQMLRDQVAGKIDSWAIRWYASAFLEDKLTLYPSKSLVYNIGMDGSGTHCPQSDWMNTNLTMEPIKIEKIVVKESLTIRNEYKRFFRNENSKKKKVLEAVEKKKSQIRNFLKPLVPPLILERARRFRNNMIYFSGEYYKWEIAARKASGYNEDIILEKNLDAALKVKSGQYSFERDSVSFTDPEYVYSLLCGIMIAQQRDKKNLFVLDYGGSLGSLYFQHRSIIDQIENLSWTIVEQPHFVTAGKEHLEDERLRFTDTITEFDSKNNLNLLVFSSVLQYLPDPYKVLEDSIKLRPDVILIDRTSFLKNSTREHLRIQNNPTNICKSSYPCWFLLRKKLEDKITSFGYEIKSRHDSADDLSYEYEWGGAIFRKLL